MEKRNISDLPPEILIKIFEHLKSPDIFKISEVCKDWLNIAQHPAIVRKTIVKLHTVANNNFINSSRKFFISLSLDNQVNSEELPAKYFQFKEKWGEYIIEIDFNELYLPSLETFLQYIKDLKNLRKLRFNRCRFKDLTIYPSSEVKFLNITSLEFIRDGEDSFVAYILSKTPNLKSLSAFVSCHLTKNEPILSYLMNPILTKSLRELCLSHKMPCDAFDLFATKHLNLEIFQWFTLYSFHNNNCNKNDDFEAFLKSQTNLKVLKLMMNAPFLPQLIRICSLNSVQDLAFDSGYANEKMGIENYEIFWKLTHLNLSSANVSLFNSLTKTSSMESLKLKSYDDDINDNRIIDKFQYLPNLIVLKIVLDRSIHEEEEYERVYITNKLIQEIFKHLLNLRELYLKDYISDEALITDYDITGFPNGFPMSRLDKLEKLELFTNTNGLTDASVRHIERMKSLKPNQVKITKSKNANFSNNPIFFKERDYFM